MHNATLCKDSSLFLCPLSNIIEYYCVLLVLDSLDGWKGVAFSKENWGRVQILWPRLQFEFPAESHTLPTVKTLLNSRIPLLLFYFE